MPVPYPRHQVTALLLAGGGGSRMGGRDKGLLSLHGRPLAAWAASRLRPQAHALLVSANRNAAVYAALGAPVLADPPGLAGPLAGVLAGLEAAATPWLLCAPADAPCLPPDLGPRLHRAAAGEGVPLAVAHDGSRRQHLFLLARTALAPRLRTWLEAGGRAAWRWLEAVGPAEARFDTPRAFVNVNTPQALQDLRREAEPCSRA